jgi:hypothetical protein
MGLTGIFHTENTQNVHTFDELAPIARDYAVKLQEAELKIYLLYIRA